MSRKGPFPCVVALCIVFFAFAQEQAEKVSIGAKEAVHSAVLNENRNVHIMPEESYMSILARSLTEGLRAFGSK